MKHGFWTTVKQRADAEKRPIFAMAPMANVTDAAFRRMFAGVREAERAKAVTANGLSGGTFIGMSVCGPDVFWTEFVSVEGLLSAGREQLLIDLWHTPAERPIVAQIFGGKPEQFEEVAKLIRELGFDGIDINMGCPDSGVEKSGGGAALIKNPEFAREIIRATKRGAGALPVSVKTRLGYRSTDEMTAWLTALLEEDIAALTVHLRTRNEMSAVPAHWELARDLIALRDRIAPLTCVLGNGDIASLEEGRQRAAESGFDGVMIGRGIFGNPWVFTEAGRAPDLRTRLMGMVEHTELYEKLYRSKPVGERQLKNFDVMKKHFKAYCSDFDGAKELRIKLMETENAAQVRALVEECLKNN
jgi:tRNA-dihydrouridine synthase